jgi:hypothetical protein
MSQGARLIEYRGNGMRKLWRCLTGGVLVGVVVVGVSTLGGDVAQAAITCNGVTAGTSLTDCAFADPVLTTAPPFNYAYGPTGTAWTYLAGAGDGVTGNGSLFTFSQVAPDGNQVGFIQGADSSISQAISGWKAGKLYTLTMSVAQRTFGCGVFSSGAGCGPQNLEVLLDGVVIGTFTASSGTYTDMSTKPFAASAGSHTLTIKGLNTVPGYAGQDNTAFIDALRLTSVSNVPTTFADCKNGGWRNYGGAGDTPFKNQGDCVSYVATGGRNPAG